MKVGLLGGTFDPIHYAHLAVAEEARRRVSLDEIVFIPAGRPWMRVGGVTPAAHRVEMVRLAIAGKPYFSVSTIEVDRQGPTYTVDTLAELKQGRYRDDELFFIVGWDAFQQMPGWRDPQRIVSLCRFIVVPRPGFPPPDMARLTAAIPSLAGRATLLDGPHLDESATELRSRLAAGLSLEGLVPPAVEQYVRKNRLYLAD